MHQLCSAKSINIKLGIKNCLPLQSQNKLQYGQHLRKPTVRTIFLNAIYLFTAQNMLDSNIFFQFHITRKKNYRFDTMKLVFPL